MALISEVPRGTLVGKTCEWNSDFRVSKNEMTIEVCESKERLDVFDFLGFRPILDDLDLVRGHGEAFGRQHVSEVFQEVTWNSHLSACANSPLVRSLRSTSLA